jgi:hypothetical protein
MSWAAASTTAEEFVPLLEKDWPEFVEEMKGKSTQRLSQCLVYNVVILGFRNRAGSRASIPDGVGDELTSRNINGSRS